MMMPTMHMIEKVPFSYQDQHMTFDILVNGKPLLVALDTGAYTTQIPASDVSAFGLTTTSTKTEVQTRGPSFQVQTGSTEAAFQNIQENFKLPFAAVSNYSMPYALLGLDFFRDNGLNFAVDWQSNTLYIFSDVFGVSPFTVY